MIASALAYFRFSEEGKLRERPHAVVTQSVDGYVFRFAFRSFHRSRSVLGLFLLLVEGFGLDDDAEAVGRTDRPSNARISDAWRDHHDLKHMSLALPSEEHHVCKLDNRAISAELGVVKKRVGGSSRVWSVEFVKERKLAPGGKVYADFFCGSEPVSRCPHPDLLIFHCDQPKLNGNGTGKGKKKGGKNAASCCVSFWTPDGQNHISGYLPNSPRQLGILSRVSNF